jgi:cytochrome P450
MNSSPEEASNKADLLHILLTDKNFSGDKEMIADECFTFFFAGSQTSATATTNLILHLLTKEEYHG